MGFIKREREREIVAYKSDFIIIYLYIYIKFFDILNTYFKVLSEK